MCKGNFKKVSRVFQGRLKSISMEFKWVSRVFKEVQWVFEESFKGVSMAFPGSFKGVSKKVKGVSRDPQG